MGGGGGVVFFFKQKTAYEIGTGDWSSDVCSSDLLLKIDTLACEDNTGDEAAKDVESTEEEVIEVSEDEISADEEQDDEAEQSETEDDDGGELERVESTDKEGKR